MGNFLASPITDKETHRGEGNGLRYGISAMQGWRTNMEDSHIAVLEPAKLPEGNAVFAVCDGHGGKFAAIEAEKLMVDVFGEVMAEESFGVAKTNPSPEAIGSAMREAFMRLDDRIRSKPEVQYGSDQSGCTAISAIVTPEHIIVANAGTFALESASCHQHLICIHPWSQETREACSARTAARSQCRRTTSP